MRRAAEFLATAAYSGYVPKAPGTAGSAVGVLIVYLAFRFLNVDADCLFIPVALLLWPSVKATDVMIEMKGTKDPQCVVIDEVLGQMLALQCANLESAWSYLAAFLLFRAFDIWKPFPVRRFEAIPGGLGVILDDIMAGIYALAVMYALRHTLHLPL